MSQIVVQNVPITVISDTGLDYICLTDMAGAKNDEVRAADVIKKWLRNRYTIEFLGTWEQIHNPNFKVLDLLNSNPYLTNREMADMLTLSDKIKRKKKKFKNEDSVH